MGGCCCIVRGGWCCLAERGSKAHGSKYLPRKGWVLEKIKPIVLNALHMPEVGEDGFRTYPEAQIETASLQTSIGKLMDLNKLADALRCVFYELNDQMEASNSLYERVVGRTHVRIVSDTLITCALPFQNFGILGASMNVFGKIGFSLEVDAAAPVTSTSQDSTTVPTSEEVPQKTAQTPLLSATLTLFRPPELINIVPGVTHLNSLSGCTLFLSRDSIYWADENAFCRVRDPVSGMSRTYAAHRVAFNQFECVGLEAFREGLLEVTIETDVNIRSQAITLTVRPALIQPTSFATTTRRGLVAVVKKVKTTTGQHFSSLVRVPARHRGESAMALANWAELDIITPASTPYTINDANLGQETQSRDISRFPRRCFLDGREVGKGDPTAAVATCPLPIFGDSWGRSSSAGGAATAPYSYLSLSPHASNLNSENVDSVVSLSRAGEIAHSVWIRENDLGNANRMVSACETSKTGDYPLDDEDPRSKLRKCTRPAHRQAAFANFRSSAYVQSTIGCQSHFADTNLLHRRARMRGPTDVDCGLTSTRKEEGVQVIGLELEGSAMSMGTAAIRVAPLPSLHLEPVGRFFGPTTVGLFANRKQVVKISGREIGETSNPVCEFATLRKLRSMGVPGETQVYYHTEQRKIRTPAIATWPRGSAHGVRCVLPGAEEEFSPVAKRLYYLNVLDDRHNRVWISDEISPLRMIDYSNEGVFGIEKRQQPAAGIIFPEMGGDSSEILFEFHRPPIADSFDLEAMLNYKSVGSCLFCNGQRTLARAFYRDRDKPTIACGTPSLSASAFPTCSVKLSTDGVNIVAEATETVRLKAGTVRSAAFDSASDEAELAWRVEFPPENNWVSGFYNANLGIKEIAADAHVRCLYNGVTDDTDATDQDHTATLPFGIFPLDTSGTVLASSSVDGRQVSIGFSSYHPVVRVYNPSLLSCL